MMSGPSSLFEALPLSAIDQFSKCVLILLVIKLFFENELTREGWERLRGHPLWQTVPTRKRLVAAILVVLVLLGSWQAFAFGDIVHDPISYANALLMLMQIIRSYEQLKADYDLDVWNSTPVPTDMGTAYRVPGVPWYELQLMSDRFGRLSGWLGAVNQAGSAWQGYGAASILLRDSGTTLGKLALDEQEKLATRFATVELTDGTNVHGIETVGQLRTNAVLVDTSLQALEEDSLSMLPEMNTELAVLNKINAAAIAELRVNRDTNRLLLSTLEQQVVNSKRQRDAEASELNVQMMKLNLGDIVKAQHTETLGESLRSFRWR